MSVFAVHCHTTVAVILLMIMVADDFWPNIAYLHYDLVISFYSCNGRLVMMPFLLY